MSDTPPPPSSGAENALTRKLGPLPAWAWGGLVVGGIWLWYRVKGGSSLPSFLGGTGTASSVQATAPANGVDALPVGTALPTDSGSGSAVSSTTPGSASASTNAQWSSQVANALIATGNYSANDVSNAIANYLNGNQLTAQQGAIINIAVKQFGEPPQGVIPVSVAPDPSTQIVQYQFYLDGSVWAKYADGHLVPVSPGQSAAAQRAGYTLVPINAWPPGYQAKTPATPSPTPSVPSAPAPAPAPAPRQYTVRPGDNLSAIAMRYYGSPNWLKIYNANRGVIGGNPNLIRPGEILTIP